MKKKIWIPLTIGLALLSACKKDDTPQPKEPVYYSAIPNGGFECFSHAESDKYYSLYDPASPDSTLQHKWWCTGNKGSTTLSSKYSVTMPDYEDKVEGEASLKMASTYVLIKFAAGNVFTGEYVETNLLKGSGTINFGRPYHETPSKLSLWLKYQSGVISEKTLNDKPEGDPVKVGDKDRAIVWIALGDWDYKTYGGTEFCPVQVNTADKSTFFDPDSEAVIAYGNLILEDSTDGWIKAEIPLEYRSERTPTHIIISAAASLLGDYFTGSAESILWIDDLKLE
ncbi:MAG: PCMD domain-containing protein [Candidatus Cryptobacteroides sp.]